MKRTTGVWNLNSKVTYKKRSLFLHCSPATKQRRLVPISPATRQPSTPCTLCVPHQRRRLSTAASRTPATPTHSVSSSQVSASESTFDQSRVDQPTSHSSAEASTSGQPAAQQPGINIISSSSPPGQPGLEQSSSQLLESRSSNGQTLTGQQSTRQQSDHGQSKYDWLKLPWSSGKAADSAPPDPDVIARQRWSWLLLGVGIFAFGQWVCNRVLTWERYAEFAPGMVLTMKDHTRKKDIWERLVPRYKLKIGFATGEGGPEDPRYAFTTYLTPLNRKLFEKVYYDGHAATLPVLYDSVDPTYCRLDDHNHYNLGKVLMYLGVWVAFINAMKLTLESLSKIRGWGGPGGVVYKDKAGAVPTPLEVVKQAA